MIDTDVEVDRRGFLRIGGAAVAMLSTGGTALAQQTAVDFDDAAILLGPLENRPAPGSGFFDDKVSYHYLYWDSETGGQWTIDETENDWQLLSGSRSRVIDVLDADVTVSNTLVETTVFSPTVLNNHILVKDRYELPVIGTYTTSNSTEQFTIRFHMGGTEVASVQSVQANVSDRVWWARLMFTVRAIGADGIATIKPNVISAFDNTHDDQSSAEVTIDTDIDEDFSVTVQWDEANPGNSLIVEQASLERVGTG